MTMRYFENGELSVRAELLGRWNVPNSLACAADSASRLLAESSVGIYPPDLWFFSVYTSA